MARDRFGKRFAGPGGSPTTFSRGLHFEDSDPIFIKRSREARRRQRETKRAAEAGDKRAQVDLVNQEIRRAKFRTATKKPTKVKLKCLEGKDDT
jgi:hypothetical protein